MGFIVAGAAAFFAYVAAAVAAAIETFLAAVVIAAHAIGTAIVGIISIGAGTVGGILSGLGLVSVQGVMSTLAEFGILNTLTVVVYENIFLAISAISAGFTAFLEIIHFKTLVGIHNVLFAVSQEYRQMYNDLMYDVMQWSGALQVGASFIPMALENARAVVLDTSAMMGREYDVGDLVWFSHFSAWADRISLVAGDLSQEPGQILQYINELVLRPEINNKATVMQTVFTTTDRIIKWSEETAGQLTKVRDDLDEFVDELPGFIKDYIADDVHKYTQIFDDFMADKYQPAIDSINNVIDAFSTDILESKNVLQTLANRLRKPGDYLKEIDTFDLEERIRQENAIGEISTRALFRSDPNRKSRLDDISKTLESIETLDDLEIPEATWYVTEAEISPIKDDTPVEPKNTPFVGDY